MDGLGRPSTIGGYTFSFNYLITFVVYSGVRYNLVYTDRAKKL